ncbi:sigma-70 family RNA polymerase sigma factor [Fictibacillus halophilus]|uniref:sigma-70 family RNA polymerase sigma factor n=1 Tax=Fictibacillus halophilus TaxID=1610490 RepID=UPI001CFB1DE2|nr:sigma-70 family RNA polymerase sigma factor [Fictibacillus halophilus]
MQLDEVYELYMNDLYRYLFSLSKDHYVAEDLVQEAFYRAYMTLEDYEINNIKAWLFKVAYHAFVDYQRKNKRTVLEEDVKPHLNADQNTPESKMLEKESLRLLLEDLNLLQENEKQAVLLCDLHELSYQEAADILDLKLNTFKSHMVRGRKKLMVRVKERMNRDERSS